MEILGVVLVVLLFIIGMIGTVYPVLPGVFAIYAAFFVHGFGPILRMKYITKKTGSIFLNNMINMNG